MIATPALDLAEILAALSLATDLANDQPFESGLRTTLLATELARRAGGTSTQIADVYYAGLLRFIGCTSFSHEGAELFGGDDNACHSALAAVDLRRTREVLDVARSRAGSGSLFDRAQSTTAFVAALPVAASVFAASSCEVGHRLATRLGMSVGVTEALASTYERWDGRGKPNGLAGEAIPWVARVVQVARMAELLARTRGLEEAIEVLTRRADGQLDPLLVGTMISVASELVGALDLAPVWDGIVQLGRAAASRPASTTLDHVAQAFADFVDLKSVHTLGHSSAVSALAEASGRSLGMTAEECTTLRHAGLLHDLGRVGIPSGVWDKRGPLTTAEWERVRLHPYYTERILSRSPLLAPLAAIAGAHHERLDGSGYHRNVPASLITRAGRVLAAADTYAALCEHRPHRSAMSPDDAAKALEAEASAGRLDRETVQGVLDAAGHVRRATPSEWPRGLSEREVEVLRWVAKGSTNKEVAVSLSISPRTVQHHVRHIYSKIGVSTRAGAALFAIENDLLPG